MRLRSFRRSRLVLGTLVVLALAVAVGVPSAIALLGGGDERGEPTGRVRAPNPHPVAGNFRPDGTKVAECGAKGERCYEQTFGNLAYRGGPKQAMAFVDRMMQSEPMG